VFGEISDRLLAGSDCDLHHIIWMIVMGTLGVTLIVMFVMKLKDRLFADCVVSKKMS
jgi:hypothetical protein